MPIPNRLAKETSPYLLQHADNPVDWYPWGEEALSKAKAEDKPILLGSGLSFKDWYFAEGGIGGPCKLQGHKALDSRHAKMKAKEINQELNNYLRQPLSRIITELEKAARERALAVLQTLPDRPSAN